MAKSRSSLLVGPDIRLAALEPEPPLAKSDYEKRLRELEYRMRAISLAYRDQGRSAVLVFEGWDAAGKGGAIRRLTGELDPRGYRVWPIGAPSEEERGHHYLHRFWTRLPARGTLAVFDRSWYGRVLVERVDRLTPEDVWRRAYDEILGFEDTLVAEGTRLVKLFMHVSAEEQRRRLVERMRTPWKRWKIGPDDLRNHTQRDDYAQAVEEMFARTSTAVAPWHAIAGDDKRQARLAVIERVADILGEGVDLNPPPPSPELVQAMREQFAIEIDVDVDIKT